MPSPVSWMVSAIDSVSSILATDRNIAASTQNQALSALLCTVQDLLDHKDVGTTQIYTHVMQRGANATRSPLDP